jgi:hypothetical protein
MEWIAPWIPRVQGSIVEKSDSVRSEFFFFQLALFEKLLKDWTLLPAAGKVVEFW